MPTRTSPHLERALRSEHRPSNTLLKDLSLEDLDQLALIVSNANDAQDRVKAVSLLGAASPERSLPLLSTIVSNHREPATLRAVAATEISRTGSPGGERVLIGALSGRPESIVRIKLAAALARNGGEAGIEALSRLVNDGDVNVREQARFSRSVIAYRLRRPGHELPVPGASDLIANDATRLTSATLRRPGREIAGPAFEQIRRDSFGVRLSERNALHIQCEANSLFIVLDKSLDEPTRSGIARPALAGLVANRAPSDGTFSTRWLIMTWPMVGESFHISVNRPSGRQMFYGTGRLVDGVIEFRLGAVSGPGARYTSVRGRVARGSVELSEVLSGRRLAARQPRRLVVPR